MLSWLKAIEVKIAGVLPGLKTKLTLAVGIVFEVATKLSPDLLDPIVPQRFQDWVPLILMICAVEFHRMHDMHQ